MRSTVAVQPAEPARLTPPALDLPADEGEANPVRASRRSRPGADDSGPLPSTLYPLARGAADEAATPRLSIVIVTHNVKPLLRACLESVRASRAPFEVEVCVVDTGNDGSARLVRAELREVATIEAPENPGFGAANNLGLRRTRGDYCLLLNPDTVLPPGALAELVAAMDAEPRIGILGPKLVRANGELDLACRRSFPTPWNALCRLLLLSKLFPRWRLVGRYNLTYRDPDEAYDVDAVTGAFMLIRRQVLERVGLHDETFWMYGEDLDLCWRSKAHGWRTRYHPAVQVLHLKGQSSKARSLRCTYEFFRAMHIFYQKHYAGTAPPLQNALVTAGIVVAGAAALVADRLRPAALRRVS